MSLLATGYLQLTGGKVEYRWIEPQHPGLSTLVLLHEGLGCVSMWRDFPDQLAEATGCGVFAYSRLGYGGSDPVPLPRPLTYMHDEARILLPELLMQLPFDRYSLIGHSDGASIAIVYAGSVADNALDGVVLIAPHVFCEDLSIDSIKKVKALYEQGELKRRLSKYHGINVDCAFWGWNSAWLDDAFKNWNLEQYLPEISVPGLVIQGVDDEYGTLAQVTAIQRQYGGALEVQVIEKCGHAPHREATQQTLNLIHHFQNRE